MHRPTHSDITNTTDPFHDGPRGRRGHRRHRGPGGHGRRGGRPAPRPVDPEASELELIQHLARHLRRGSAVETAPWGLSPHQARALAVISRAAGRRHHRGSNSESPQGETSDSPTATNETAEPTRDLPAVYTGLRLGALAEWLQIAPRSATEVVDGLEELGLVARTPDPEDRRAILVGLTEQGRQVASEIRAARKAQTETLLEELSTEDRAQLRASLLTLLEAATSR